MRCVLVGAQALAVRSPLTLAPSHRRRDSVPQRIGFLDVLLSVPPPRFDPPACDNAPCQCKQMLQRVLLLR